MRLSEVTVEINSPKLITLELGEDSFTIPSNFLFVKKHEGNKDTLEFERFTYVVVPVGVEGSPMAGLCYYNPDGGQGDTEIFLLQESEGVVLRAGTASVTINEATRNGVVEPSQLPGYVHLCTSEEFLGEDESSRVFVANTILETCGDDPENPDEEAYTELLTDLIDKTYVLSDKK